MATENKSMVCDFCKKGGLTKSVEQLKFRQSSNKGYVHCRVRMPVCVCDFCGARSLEWGADQILNQAFQREYDNLP
jgi:hypothetical protein